MVGKIARDNRPPSTLVYWEVSIEGKIVASSNPDIASQCTESLGSDNLKGCKALIDRLLR